MHPTVVAPTIPPVAVSKPKRPVLKPAVVAARKSSPKPASPMATVPPVWHGTESEYTLPVISSIADFLAHFARRASSQCTALHISTMSDAEDLDFDLAHYSLSELRAFFGIDPTQIHTAADIDARAHQIRETLVASGRIRKGAMRAFVVFVASAAEKLIESTHTNTPSIATSSSANAVIPSLPRIAPNEFYIKSTSCLLAVDTRYRAGGSYAGNASDFTLTLPNRLNKVIEMDLMSLELPPRAIHNVSRALRNSHFLLRIVFFQSRCDPHADPGKPVGVHEYMVTVEDGRYESASQLVNAVNDAIHDATLLNQNGVAHFDPGREHFDRPVNGVLDLIRASYCTQTNRVSIGPVLPTNNTDLMYRPTSRDEPVLDTTSGNDYSPTTSQRGRCGEYYGEFCGKDYCEDEYCSTEDVNIHKQCTKRTSPSRLKIDTTGVGFRSVATVLPPCDFIVELDFSTDEQGNPDETHEAAYYTRLGRVLGFVRRKYSGGRVDSPGHHTDPTTDIQAEAQVDLNLCVRYIFLEVDDFQGQYTAAFIPATAGAASASAILAKIVLNDAVGATGEGGSQVLSASRVYLGPTELSRLHIRLTDPRGRIINLAGDFSFTLRFRQLYDSPLVK